MLPCFINLSLHLWRWESNSILLVRKGNNLNLELCILDPVCWCHARAWGSFSMRITATQSGRNHFVTILICWRSGRDEDSLFGELESTPRITWTVRLSPKFAMWGVSDFAEVKRDAFTAERWCISPDIDVFARRRNAQHTTWKFVRFLFAGTADWRRLVLTGEWVIAAVHSHCNFSRRQLNRFCYNWHSTGPLLPIPIRTITRSNWRLQHGAQYTIDSLIQQLNTIPDGYF